MNAKEELHRLIDQLPESELHAVRRFVQFIREKANDPLLWMLENAPLEDEPISAEEEKAVEEARKEVARGEVVSHEDLRSELRL